MNIIIIVAFAPQSERATDIWRHRRARHHRVAAGIVSPAGLDHHLSRTHQRHQVSRQGMTSSRLVVNCIALPVINYITVANLHFELTYIIHVFRYFT